MGGYENNPILLDKIPNDFNFGLYELDYSVFDTHIEGAVKLCPTFGNAGIKSTICGPESFTPDHKPLMVNKRFYSVQYMLELILIDMIRLSNSRGQIHISPVCSTTVDSTLLEWCWARDVRNN